MKLSVLALGLISFVVTGFILGGAYELAFSQDLPVVKAIDRVSVVSISDAERSGIIEAQDAFEKDRGSFGLPSEINLTGSPSNMELNQAIYDDSDWYARQSNAHYVMLNGTKSDLFGDLLVYLRQGFRTVAEPDNISTGDTIHVYTNELWDLRFEVVDTDFREGSSFASRSESELTSLYVNIYDAERDTSHIIHAVLSGISEVR